MGGIGIGSILSNKKKTVSIVVIAAIAVMLVSSVMTMYTAEAKSKSKNKVHVVFGDARSYKGKLTLKLKNLDTDKVLLKETIDFKKLNKRSDCCEVTFSFEPKGSHVGDELLAKAIGGGGSWESAPEPYKKGTIHFSIDLDEIGQ
jgi:hypothetical protein